MCRFMATSGVVACNQLQLWMDIKLYKSDNGATELEMGCLVPYCGRTLHSLCKLAPSFFSVC